MRNPATEMIVKECFVPACRKLTCPVTSLAELSKGDMARIRLRDIIPASLSDIASAEAGSRVLPDHQGIVPETEHSLNTL